jgi:protein involved in polysaccharide export with SLBB domain
MLGSLEGRKSVIYFAPPVVRSDSDQLQLRSVIDSAIRAKAAFYSVDARGLIPQLPPHTGAYVIGPEDVLQISVAQREGISASYTVRPDGMISVPPIGDVRAAGLTAAQLEAVIADRLEALVSRPSVTVGVLTVHQPQ